MNALEAKGSAQPEKVRRNPGREKCQGIKNIVNRENAQRFRKSNVIIDVEHGENTEGI